VLHRPAARGVGPVWRIGRGRRQVTRIVGGYDAPAAGIGHRRGTRSGHRFNIRLPRGLAAPLARGLTGSLAGRARLARIGAGRILSGESCGQDCQGKSAGCDYEDITHGSLHLRKDGLATRRWLGGSNASGQPGLRRHRPFPSCSQVTDTPLTTARDPLEAPAWLDGLNPPQKQAVLTTEGPVLMLAGAGTGKTAALTARLAYLIRTRRAWPSEILCVTFTNKAAREMRHRVGQLIGDAVEGMPWLGTFHAICAKMLRRHAELVGLQSNFTIIDTDDQLRVLKQLIADNSLDEK